jgi:hypothetical protein
MGLIGQPYATGGPYPANLATVAWCTAIVLAIDRQLSPGRQALEGFDPLMIGELGLATEAVAFRHGGAAAVVGSFEDKVPLILGQCR